MRIDKRLCLVIPIYAEDDVPRLDMDGKPVLDENGKPIIDTPIVAQVHSTPLGEAVVDRYFMVLGQTYNAIFAQGLGFAAGPGHAMRVLRHIATERGVWNDDPAREVVGVERGLVEEIRRLTNVVGPGPEGRWDQTLPLQVAADLGVISQEDRKEVENAIAFFIVVYATLNRSQREGVLAVAGELWGAQFTSSSFTEWSSSLRMSTGIGSSGGKSHATVSAGSAPAAVPTGERRLSRPS